MAILLPSPLPHYHLSEALYRCLSTLIVLFYHAIFHLHLDWMVWFWQFCRSLCPPKVYFHQYILVFPWNNENQTIIVYYYLIIEVYDQIIEDEKNESSYTIQSPLVFGRPAYSFQSCWLLRIP